MVNLFKKIWSAPASKIAAGLTAAIGVLTTSDIGSPDWVIIVLTALSMFLSVFEGERAEKNRNRSSSVRRSFSVVLLAGLMLSSAGLLTSCGTGLNAGLRFSSDGCTMVSLVQDGREYAAGPCIGADLDGDGRADIDRYRIAWRNQQDDQLRADYIVATEEFVVEYLTPEGLWVEWSAKSGTAIGFEPPPVQRALRGDLEPIRNAAQGAGV